MLLVSNEKDALSNSFHAWSEYPRSSTGASLWSMAACSLSSYGPSPHTSRVTRRSLTRPIRVMALIAWEICLRLFRLVSITP